MVSFLKDYSSFDCPTGAVVRIWGHDPFLGGLGLLKIPIWVFLGVFIWFFDAAAPSRKCEFRTHFAFGATKFVVDVNRVHERGDIND